MKYIFVRHKALTINNLILPSSSGEFSNADISSRTLVAAAESLFSPVNPFVTTCLRSM